MEHNTIELGKQVMRAIAIRNSSLGFWSDHRDLAQILECPVDEVISIDNWSHTFKPQNLYHDFLFSKLGTVDDSYFAMYNILYMYGNSFLRNVFPMKNLNWKKITDSYNQNCNSTNRKSKEEIIELFNSLKEYKDTLIFKCQKQYDPLVVSAISDIGVDFSNKFECGYLEGYLNARKEVIDEMDIGSIEAFQSRCTSDEKRIFFPDSHFKALILDYKKELTNYAKAYSLTIDEEALANEIAIGIAIINHTGVQETAYYLSA